MSVAFDLTLKATGYVSGEGQDAAGLLRPNHRDALRLRSVFANKRVGLNADALFFVQGAPTILFKDAGKFEPSDKEVRHWREAAWNIAVAPLLWIITPTEVRLYDCYRAPRDAGSEAPLGRFSLEDSRLTDLRDIAGRLATETGAFWSSPLGAKIDRRHRVDRELLGEISALEAKLTALPAARGMADPYDPAEQQASRDFAQRLIGRCIFTWYLFDRGIVDAFRPKAWSGDLAERFATAEAAFGLFDWLRSTFNGDLFPMDDPGAERSRLGDKHLGLIRDFIRGQSLVDGQGRLFRFRFDAIPVDLVSSIYQQFARSSAAADAQRQGLHYTPVELVHLTLDPVFEQLDSRARVIDPTCGSGAFLVEAFRRLVWRRCGGLPAKRAVVREILYTQLFGVDINRSALGIAAFSLYLAALEFDEEPLQSLADLKFHRLIGVTLFEADALDDLPEPLTARPFDAVVGNPPWTFDSDQRIATRKAGGARPRRSPDQAFLKVAARLAGDAGRVGMVMKATPFFSREGHAVTARGELLETLAPVGLVNLSALRREGLFPDATAPALLLLARCALMPDADQVLVGSAPWTPDFRRNGLFHLGPGEVRPVPLKRLLKTPALLKAAAFGTARDVWLIERLEREHRTLDIELGRLGIPGQGPDQARGQGYQVKGALTRPPEEYSSLKTLTPSAYLPFRLAEAGLEPFTHDTLHRPRTVGIFKGPILLCPKGSFTAAAEAGRFSAAVYPGDLLYTENFYGISFAE